MAVTIDFSGSSGALSTGVWDLLIGSMPVLNGSGGLVAANFSEFGVAGHKTATTTLSHKVGFKLGSLSGGSFFPTLVLRRSGAGGTLSCFAVTVDKSSTSVFVSRYVAGVREGGADFDVFTTSVNPVAGDIFEAEVDLNATNPEIKIYKNSVLIRTVTYTGTISGTGTGIGLYMNDSGPSIDEWYAEDLDDGLDHDAPVLSSPTASATGSSTGSGSVSTDEANGELFFVVTESATPPTATQIHDGEDHSDDPAIDSGSQAVSTTGVQSIVGGFTGLTPETTYYVHYCHVDEAANSSIVASTSSFTTGSTEDDVSISGNVTAGGTPVEGARVYLIDTVALTVVTTLTDSDGDYVFEGLVGERFYHVTVQHEDEGILYNGRSQPFMVPV